ncbi:imidazole glycerol phosphate synthase subunit HisH [Sphingomonas sp. Leaf412]|uniref:imidazole glycerol phosphate synthase subunit HisH n=1 Tax=Sphingomonas sp. Leaf412 TaxID=1736370 RepID=UPI0006F1D2F6|nr:imidazole glycerol phosphate synthase subunit HisH [Sphingomonas sp. Leaf412]KQT31148.1 imidazole glycerol phosphate synthase subunit HisH [Sphingomonas sp. Leaf412]
MIHVVDYGLGNIGAFLTLYDRLGISAKAVSDPAGLHDAERILLPGVGAFDHAMALLDESGLRMALDEQVLERKVPVLGVCVGMQIMSDGSDEGQRSGLGWIAGRTHAFESRHPPTPETPLPHMGWNDIEATADRSLFAGLDDPRFYFLHSYFVEPDAAEHRAASSHYGFEFACAINRDNIWGVQFHPEKSHHFGAALLKNFSEL